MLALLSLSSHRAWIVRRCASESETVAEGKIRSVSLPGRYALCKISELLNREANPIAGRTAHVYMYFICVLADSPKLSFNDLLKELGRLADLTLRISK